MRILKTVLFGLGGVIIGLGIYDIVLTYTGYEYGLVVSFIGSLTAAHVALGYLGQKQANEEDYGLLMQLAIVFAVIGAIAPYFILTSFSDGSELIFIAIGVYGGYECTKFLWHQQHNNMEDYESIVPTQQKISAKKRLSIILRKSKEILSWYLISTVIVLLLGNYFFEGFGVSWIILIGLIIYELWKKRVFVITNEDLNR